MSSHVHSTVGIRMLGSSLLLSALVACGGGGSSGAEEPASAAAVSSEADKTITRATTTGESVVVKTEPVPTPATSTTTPATTAATTAPTTAASEASAAASAPGAVAEAASAASAGTNSATIGSARTLGSTATLSVAGVIDAITRVVSNPRSALSVGTGRVFYVNSQTGSDTGNGLAASSAWRTLARLMQSDLKAGDSVELACGSVWRETLRLPANGTATQAIRVSAPAAGCATPPAIDGAVTLATSAWKLKSGSLYQTTLDSAPLQVLTAADAGAWAEAHHPNRGYLASDTTSPYLALGTRSNAVMLNGNKASTQLSVGSDLVLPKGVSPVGARVRVRTQPYVIDESPVTAFDGALLTISKPTFGPAQAGYGYYLLGQLWMLDSPGEWHYEPGTRVLSVWMPDSAAPAARVAVSTLATGVDLKSRQYIVLDGLAVRRTGLGLDLRYSQGVELRNSVVEDTADYGLNAAGSKQALLEANTFSRTGSDAIQGQGDPIEYATGFIVRNNLIRDSGVRMQGDAVLNLPRRTLAAIVGADGTTITGNTVVNGGYIGIITGKTSTVEDNFVYGSCSVQDDCAGIYTGGVEGKTVIRRNVVVHSRGMAAGLVGGTAAQGIYVDGPGSNFLVENNVVVDADVGIQVHDSSAVTVRGNRLYSNRKAALWLQEDAKAINARGDVFGNVIDANLFAPTTPKAYAVQLSTVYSATSAFAVFTNNRYYDLAATAVAYVSQPSGVRSYTLPEWLASSGVGSTQAVESGGSGVSQRVSSSLAAVGSNLVSNSNFATSTAGWYSWNQTAPAGKLTREACSVGWCARYVAGGSAGVLSSPGFTVKAGNWYRLTLDIATEQENQSVPLVVRVGGRDYSSVSDRNLNFVSGRTWVRRSVLFQATQTVDPADASKGGYSARIDIDGIEAAKSVTIGNVELVAVTPSSISQTSASIVNAGSTAMMATCPLAGGSQAASCSRFYNLADGQPVTWPLSVPARSALLLYAQESSSIDSDGDGIADPMDRCAATAAGAVVNSLGCSLAQR